MYEYQISKYDPKYRVNGIYIRNEWSGETDIGKFFEDGKLTRQEYDAVLDSYVECAMEILSCDHIEQMTISDIEIYADDVVWQEKEVVKKDRIASVIYDCMHEKCWCRLSYGETFIHFGYELYMYIGCGMEYDKLASICTQHNLFAIKKESPYKEQSE